MIEILNPDSYPRIYALSLHFTEKLSVLPNTAELESAGLWPPKTWILPTLPQLYPAWLPA